MVRTRRSHAGRPAAREREAAADRRVVAVLVGVQLTAALGFHAAMAHVVAHLRFDLGLLAGTIGLVLGVRLVVQYGLYLPVGALTDLIGPAPAGLLACVLRAAGFALLGAAEGVAGLLVSAVLLGAGGALFHPANRSLLAGVAPVTRSRAFAAYTVTGQLAAVAGPPIGLLLTAGALGGLLSPPAPAGSDEPVGSGELIGLGGGLPGAAGPEGGFGVLAGVAAVAWIAAAVLFALLHRLQVPATGTPVPGTPVPGTPVPGTPVPGTPVSGTPVSGTPVSGTPVSGRGAIRRAVTRRGAVRLRSRAAQAAGGVAGGVAAVLRDRAFVRFSLVTAPSTLLVTQPVTVVPLRGIGEEHTTLYLCAAALVAAAVQPLVAARRRAERRWAIPAGLLCSAAGYALLIPSTGSAGADVGGLAAAAVCGGLAVGLLEPSIFQRTVRHAPPGRSGAYFGVINFVSGMVAFAGGLAVGRLFDAGPAGATAALAALASLAALSAGWTARGPGT
ncbi:MFS transporter [Nonomuraea muscovyensis]|uniref:MFS transporter n=1 Tax=Nonomuraea muscovyensis TaxID=1124761 RepID=UPI0033E7E914